MSEKTKVLTFLKEVVLDLVKGDYERLVQSGRNGEYTAEELQELVDDYPGVLTLAPADEDYQSARIYQVFDDPEYVVEYLLWVDHEQSDLTLSCRVFLHPGAEKIEIENIHVM